ncbi:MAG: hypothetical protein LBI94_01020 [Treponema sp.]|nr:hypothetical protein [Treponema sp.]
MNSISVNFPENTSGNVTLPSQKTPDRGTSSGIPGGEPFTLDVWVDDTVRGIAGLTSDQIKYAGIRNVIHLVVVDEDGNVADFQEVLKERDDQEGATLTVTGLTYGSTYKFLMLMGHKERDYTAPGYGYQDTPPTLLAAGFKSTSISRGQKISITLYPVVVDTTFTGGSTTVDAVLGDILPLDAGSWDIKWNVTGLRALYEAAPNPGTIFAGARTIVQGEDITDAEETLSPLPDVTPLGVMQILRDVSAYTGTDRAGVQNSAGFNADYVPFNLPDAAWNGWNASPPVWIIRNGVNDKPQDANTDFALGVSWGAAPAKNGNGAVNFTAESAFFYVSNGGADNSAGTPSAPFKTLTQAYDAVLANPEHKTGIIVLSSLDVDAAMELSGAPVGDAITITSDTITPWTLTRSNGTNDSVVKVTGGAKVVFSNIKIDGTNNNSETAYHRALSIEGAQTEVTLGADAQLAGKIKTGSGGGGGVYLGSGKLTMNPFSKITGKAIAPSSSDYTTGGGVYMEGGTFIMNGGTVSGEAVSGGGVFVDDGKFTMEDGEISGCTAPASAFQAATGGAGVYLGYGTFTMNNGMITRNTRNNNNYNSGSSGGGGGVFLGGGVFNMNGGAISHNEAHVTSGSGGGGGVFLLGYGKFNMKGGAISNNEAYVSGVDVGGGGVFLFTGEFNMKDGDTSGVISHNTATGNGGGVYLHGGTFTMEDGATSGVISHNTAAGCTYTAGSSTWITAPLAITRLRTAAAAAAGCI